MSDLTAAEWAANKLQYLHALEASCTDSDLFCVGYLIPQVELIETENHDVVAELAIWDAHFSEFVKGNMESDAVNEQDKARIEQLMALS